MLHQKTIKLDSSKLTISQKISNFIQDLDRQKGNYPLAIVGRQLDRAMLRKLKLEYKQLTTFIIQCEEILGKVSTLQSGSFDEIHYHQKELVMARNEVARKLESLEEQIENDLIKKREFQKNWKPKFPTLKRSQSLPTVSDSCLNSYSVSFNSLPGSCSILKTCKSGRHTLPKTKSNVSIDPSVKMIYFDQDETTLDSSLSTELVFDEDYEDEREYF